MFVDYFLRECYNFFMKNIILARKGQRILARAIDFSIVLVLTLIFFLGVIFPSNFDRAKFDANNTRIIELYEDSELFLIDVNGNYNAKCSFSNNSKLDDVYYINLTY